MGEEGVRCTDAQVQSSSQSGIQREAGRQQPQCTQQLMPSPHELLKVPQREGMGVGGAEAAGYCFNSDCLSNTHAYANY